MSESKTENPKVEFETNLGNFTLELYPDTAPATVANFLAYVDDGFYEGLIFHRIISHFMIQGGGYTGLDQEKSDGLKPPIRNEASGSISNERGTISMARTADPHSATSQFFINVVDNDMLDANAQSDGYCAFGRVVDGMDIVDKIKDVPCVPHPMMPGENSLPAEPPVIVKISRAS